MWQLKFSSSLVVYLSIVKEERLSWLGSKIRGESWLDFVKTKETSTQTNTLCSCGDSVLKIWGNWSNSLISRFLEDSSLKNWDTTSNFLVLSLWEDLFIIGGKGSDCLIVKGLKIFDFGFARSNLKDLPWDLKICIILHVMANLHFLKPWEI